MAKNFNEQPFVSMKKILWLWQNTGLCQIFISIETRVLHHPSVRSVFPAMITDRPDCFCCSLV